MKSKSFMAVTAVVSVFNMVVAPVASATLLTTSISKLSFTSLALSPAQLIAGSTATAVWNNMRAGSKVYTLGQPSHYDWDYISRSPLMGAMIKCNQADPGVVYVQSETDLDLPGTTCICAKNVLGCASAVEKSLVFLNAKDLNMGTINSAVVTALQNQITTDVQNKLNDMTHITNVTAPSLTTDTTWQGRIVQDAAQNSRFDPTYEALARNTATAQLKAISSLNLQVKPSSLIAYLDKQHIESCANQVRQLNDEFTPTVVSQFTTAVSNLNTSLSSYTSSQSTTALTGNFVVGQKGACGNKAMRSMSFVGGATSSFLSPPPAHVIDWLMPSYAWSGAVKMVSNGKSSGGSLVSDLLGGEQKANAATYSLTKAVSMNLQNSLYLQFGSTSLGPLAGQISAIESAKEALLKTGSAMTPLYCTVTVMNDSTNTPQYVSITNGKFAAHNPSLNLPKATLGAIPKDTTCASLFGTAYNNAIDVLQSRAASMNDSLVNMDQTLLTSINNGSPLAILTKDGGSTFYQGGAPTSGNAIALAPGDAVHFSFIVPTLPFAASTYESCVGRIQVCDDKGAAQPGVVKAAGNIQYFSTAGMDYKKDGTRGSGSAATVMAVPLSVNAGLPF